MKPLLLLGGTTISLKTSIEKIKEKKKELHIEGAV